MQINIDTDRKTIKLTSDTVPVGQLYDFLQTTFPDEEWKSYSFITGNTISIPAETQLYGSLKTESITIPASSSNNVSDY